VQTKRAKLVHSFDGFRIVSVHLTASLRRHTRRLEQLPRLHLASSGRAVLHLKHSCLDAKLLTPQSGQSQSPSRFSLACCRHEHTPRPASQLLNL
jgi:hypothetical protein